MKKYRTRLMNTGEELLDLQNAKENVIDIGNENLEVQQREDDTIDQTDIQGMIGVDVEELIQEDLGISLGKIDQKINKARVYRGWIKRYARKHKRVRYTSNGID